MTSSTKHLGEFDFIVPGSLPDANSPGSSAAAPWNAKPRGQRVKKHILYSGAGDWQGHIFIWQLNGEEDKCRELPHACLRVCVCLSVFVRGWTLALVYY